MARPSSSLALLRLAAVGVAIGAALACAAACGPGSPPGPPRLVLLYATCSVNKRYLAPYASGVSYTPNLRRFAEGAVTFDAHQTEAGSSGIAYASLFTGSQADRHGVYSHPMHLGEESYLLFEAFADAGWDTWFWSGHPLATPRLGYAQGVPETHRIARPLWYESPHFLALLDRLAAEPDYRALVVTGFTKTHSPYQIEPLGRFLRDHPEEAPPVDAAALRRFAALHHEHHRPLEWNLPEALRRFGLGEADLPAFAAVVETLYEGNVAELDRLFGVVLDAIEERGLADESVVAFTADHGEALYREGADFQWGHSLRLAADVLSPPLLVRWPGSQQRARRYEATTRSIDVFPTLAALAGVGLPPGAPVDGVDLSPALRGQAAPPDLSAFSHTSALVDSLARRIQREEDWRWARLRRFFPDPALRHVPVALRRGDRLFKWRHPGDGVWRFELFDLRSDPEERNDLFDAEDAAHRAAAQELEAYKARLLAARKAQGRRLLERLLPPEQEEEALRSLGYID